MALTKDAQLEALLFVSGEPLPKKRILTILGCSATELDTITDTLREHLYARGLSLIETENELELRTAPAVSDLVKKLREAELSRDLGKAGLETLAVVLYQKGATRSEIDWIRGVNSSQTVRSLMLRGLVERTEDPSDKRKFIYRATTDALAHLGVSRPEELPRYAELAKEAKKAVEEAEHEVA